MSKHHMIDFCKQPKHSCSLFCSSNSKSQCKYCFGTLLCPLSPSISNINFRSLDILYHFSILIIAPWNTIHSSTGGLTLVKITLSSDHRRTTFLLKIRLSSNEGGHSQLHHHIRGLVYDGKRILQHSKHSWIPPSHSITSSSDLGLAKQLISDRFLGAPSCKKWLLSNELRPFTAPPPHQRLRI